MNDNDNKDFIYDDGDEHNEHGFQRAMEKMRFFWSYNREMPCGQWFFEMIIIVQTQN